MSNDELQKAIDDITLGDAGMSAPVTPAMENSENNKLADEIANALAENDFEAVGPAPIMSGEMQQAPEAQQAPAIPEVKEEETPQMPEVEEPVAEMSEEMPEVAEPEDELEMKFTPEPVVEEKEESVEEPAEVPEMPEVAPSEAFEAEMEKMAKEAEEEPVEVPEMPEEVKEEPVVEEKVEEIKTEAEPSKDLEEVKKNALKELYPLLKDMNINPEQAYNICKEVAEMGEKEALGEAFEAAKKIADPAKRAEALFEIVKMIEGDEE